MANTRTYVLQRMRLFYAKLGGNGGKPMEIPPMKTVALSSIGAMLGVGSLTMLNKMTGGTDATMLIASSGATAILLFAGPALPFSQPRNVIGGHVISATSGILVYSMLGDTVATPSLAVGLALAGMMSTATIHPPAGGTALIAAASGQPFLIVPIFIASVTQVSAACLWHNAATDGRRYPQYW